jgi:GxxExxY protein
VIVEVKATEKLTPLHRAQLLTYLKLTGHTVGLLLNFNVELLRQGMRRILNG